MNGSSKQIYLPVLSLFKTCFSKLRESKKFFNVWLKDHYLECGYDQLKVTELKYPITKLIGRDMIHDR